MSELRVDMFTNPRKHETEKQNSPSTNAETIRIYVPGSRPGRPPPHGTPPGHPGFWRNLWFPFNGLARRFGEPVVRFHNVSGSSSEPLLTQTSEGCFGSHVFFSFLLFVFLKDPTLDSIAPALSKRS